MCKVTTMHLHLQKFVTVVQERINRWPDKSPVFICMNATSDAMLYK